MNDGLRFNDPGTLASDRDEGRCGFGIVGSWKMLRRASDQKNEKPRDRQQHAAYDEQQRKNPRIHSRRKRRIRAPKAGGASESRTAERRQRG